MGIGKRANIACPCGNNLKYKKCCKRLDEYLLQIEEGSIPYISIPATHSVIWPTRVDFKDYLKRLEKIPAKEAIKLLSLMNIYLIKYETYKPAQINYINDFLEPVQRNKVLRFLKASDRHTFLIEQQVTNVIKILLLINGEQVGELDKHKLGELLLIQNDYNDKTDYNNKKINRDELLGVMIRQSFANYTDNPNVSLPRNYYLICDISKRLAKSDNYIDLENEFKNATSIPFMKYVAIIFAFMGAWIIPKNNPQKKLAPIDPTSYFSNVNVSKDEANIIISACTMDYEAYKSALSQEIKEPLNAAYHNANLSEYPLIIIDGKIFPISLRLLENKLGHYVYWTLFNYLKSKGDELLNRYLRFFGEVYEHYAIEVLKIIFPSLQHNILISSKKIVHGEIDILIIDDDSIFIFEVKSSRLNIPTFVSGDIKKFEKDMEQTIIKPAKQLSRNIDALINGKVEIDLDFSKIKNIYPVILHYYPIPHELILYDFIEEKINENGYLQQDKVKPVTFMDVEGLEYAINEFEEKGIKSVFSQKTTEYKNRSFKNFLFETATTRNIHKELKERFEKVMNLVTNELFPRLFSKLCQSLLTH